MVQRIGLREIPSTSPLFADFWEGAESFRRLVPRHFRQPGAFAEQVRLLGKRRYGRDELSVLLKEQNERMGAGPAALAEIARLARPDAVVVIGGQQAGLFGGPLYTLHKALTILKAARRLEKDLSVPVVPLFWIAAEDSDLAEIDHVFVTDREGQLRQLRLPGGTQDKTPVSRIRLGEGIGPLIDELALLLPASGATEETLAALRAAYSAGKTWPQAFGAWMADLFREEGLPLVDPSDDRLKRMAQGLFEREIREKSPVSAAVIEQTARLRAAGYVPQIELREGLLTLFHQDPVRDAIAVRDGGFELKASGRKLREEELCARLAASPDAFTPNAVLRPLFQDTVFPTLAVVLGPAEVGYFSQLTLAYERMGIPMPLLFPRASLTVVDEKIEKLRARLDVGLVDLLRRGERVIDDILRREIPVTLSARIAEGQARTSDTWVGIAAEIGKLDRTLERTAEIATGRSLRQFDFMDRKIAQAARKKNEVLRSQVQRLVAALAPRGALQERTLSALPALARHGTRILTCVSEAIDAFAAEHRVVVVEA